MRFRANLRAGTPEAEADEIGSLHVSHIERSAKREIVQPGVGLMEQRGASAIRVRCPSARNRLLPMYSKIVGRMFAT
jgi:hypothetical protein